MKEMAGITIKGTLCLAETELHTRVYNAMHASHYADKCPEISGRSLAQVGVMIIQQNSSITVFWIFLNTCSIHSVSNNENLVKNIEDCNINKILTIWTNGGNKTFKKK